MVYSCITKDGRQIPVDEFGRRLRSWEDPVRPSLDGMEVRPGVTLIGEPTQIAGTDKFTCLANVAGALCLVELRITSNLLA